MSWLRLEGRMPHHRKIAPLSDAAFRLHVTASAWCVEEESDGRVPVNIHATLPAAPRGKALARTLLELVSAGLWDLQHDGGHVIHDFLGYNPSAAQGKARREAAALKGAAGGRAKASAGHGNSVPLIQQPAKPAASTQLAGSQDPAKQPAKLTPTNARRADPTPTPTPTPIPTATPKPPPGGSSSHERDPSTRIRCPVPLPIPPDVLVGLHLDVGMPPAVAEANLLAWARQQSADVTDLRPLGAWAKSAIAALRGRWSDRQKRQEMVDLAASERAPDPGELAELATRRKAAEARAGEARRRDVQQALAERGITPPSTVGDVVATVARLTGGAS